MLALGGFTLSGSSPLARGSPHGPPHRQPGRGIIPARAGFTLVSACRSGVSGDHPRSRGVHGGGWGDGVAGLGSSPLARGSLLHREVGRSVDRIIPARAGFTSPTPAAAPSPSDHPRSRGVHPSASSGRATGFGSSPLARGSRHRPVRPHPQPRIIPARAGFTPGGGREHAADRDHPRSRGVHTEAKVSASGRTGSSPLARGSRRGARQPVDHHSDHPRSRGVHSRKITATKTSSGSSPLARGSPGCPHPAPSDHRIIPARAGFTPLGTAPSRG